MTARLELAGVPAVYDTGVDDLPDGRRQLWLVMRLLRGPTLETLLDGASFSDADMPSVAWAAAIAAQVAAVLADVHRVDIVHRDIKAANIMVTDGGLVKVLDFGIAILRGAGTLPRLTQVDRAVGTPAYMSPEQPEEEAARLRDDVQVLLDGEHPSDAISLLEEGLGRAVPGSVLELQMRRTLAAALLIGGQYSRAAQLFEQAGTVFRQHLGPADPWALDCAYQAGHAYAQAGKPDKALPQPRYYAMNAASLAARDPDEAAKVMESRFVVAQLRAESGIFAEEPRERARFSSHNVAAACVGLG